MAKSVLSNKKRKCWDLGSIHQIKVHLALNHSPDSCINFFPPLLTQYQHLLDSMTYLLISYHWSNIERSFFNIRQIFQLHLHVFTLLTWKVCNSLSQSHIIICQLTNIFMFLIQEIKNTIFVIKWQWRSSKRNFWEF